MQIKKIRNFLLISAYIIYVIFYPLSSHGQSLCEHRLLDEIESYLNNLNKFAVKFTQYNKEGEITTNIGGILLIEKPGKFRANYDSPHPLVIVGGNKFVSIYDYELDELSRIGAEDNIFKFLLETNLKIEDSIKIDKCVLNPESIILNLTHKETEQKAQIYFKTKPISLDKMIIPDYANPDGGDEDILIKFGPIMNLKAINKEFFTLRDNRIYGPLKRYSSEEIIKILHLK